MQGIICKKYVYSKVVHFQYHKEQTVQGSKYGSVPSSTVQLAGLGSIYMSLTYNKISLSLLQGINEWV